MGLAEGVTGVARSDVLSPRRWRAGTAHGCGSLGSPGGAGAVHAVRGGRVPVVAEPARLVYWAPWVLGTATWGLLAGLPAPARPRRGRRGVASTAGSQPQTRPQLQPLPREDSDVKLGVQKRSTAGQPSPPLSCRCCALLPLSPTSPGLPGPKTPRAWGCANETPPRPSTPLAPGSHPLPGPAAAHGGPRTRRTCQASHRYQHAAAAKSCQQRAACFRGCECPFLYRRSSTKEVISLIIFPMTLFATRRNGSRTVRLIFNKM